MIEEDGRRFCDHCGIELTEANNKCGYELCDKCNEELERLVAEQEREEAEREKKYLRYAVTLKNSEARIVIAETLSSAELDIVQDILNKAIEVRKQEVKKYETQFLTVNDEIKNMYPPLSLRTQNVLLRAGYKTIGDVLNSTKTELMRVRNMGRKSLEEIDERFSKYGKFKEE